MRFKKSFFPPNLLERMTRRKPLLFDVDVDNLSPNICKKSGSNSNTHPSKVTLRRTLSLADLILYGVGCSVGAGIYCLVGLGAEIAGPAIALSFALCGAACIFTALSYGEFAARIPVTGSAYVYAYVTFGEFVAWLVGWSLTLNYAFSASVVARSWAEYLAAFIRGLPTIQSNGWKLQWLTRMQLSWLPLVPESYTCSPLSILIVALCTAVLVTGAKESSRFNNAMTVLNLGMLGFVVFAGLGTGTVEVDNMTPFFPDGFGGVLRGSGLVFFAFIGFDMVACLSEEVKNPERNMPLGIVGTLFATTFIYVAVTLVTIGMAPFDLLGGDVPIVNALLANGCCTHEEQLLDIKTGAQCLNQACSPMVRPVLLYGSRILSFGAIFGLTTGTFTSLMGQPRIFYRMATDGLLFKIFSKVDVHTQVPTEGILITGVLCSALSCFIYLDALANLISLGTLAVFTFVNAGVIILRMRPNEDDEDEGGAVEMESSTPQSYEVPIEELEKSLCERMVSKYRRLSSGTLETNGSKPAVYTIIFTLGCVLASMSYNNGWPDAFPILCLVFAAVSACLLMQLPKAAPPETFKCPYVPTVPLLGLGCNGYMMGSLPMSSWLFLMLWLSIGLAVYFVYGIRHSVLGKEIDKENASTPLKKRTGSYNSLLWEGTRLLSDDARHYASLHGTHAHDT